MNAKLNEGDVKRVEMLHAKCAEMKKELAKRVVGQDEMVDQVLTAVFARGHALLTGVPGLAKTLLVRTLAEVMDLGFKRVQFTPDLMPADVTGTEVLDEDRTTGKHVFRFVKGPVFTNLLLADEINHAAKDPGRAPGGDAGAQRHRRRRDLSTGRAVLRARNAESD